jgi:hypothetical protein
MKRNLLIVLALIALLFLAGWTLQTTRPQLEYKVEYNASEKKINQLAQDGWELIAVSPDAETKNLTGFYFKRAKQ